MTPSEEAALRQLDYLNLIYETLKRIEQRLTRPPAFYLPGDEYESF